MDDAKTFSSKYEYNEWHDKNKWFNMIAEYFETEENWTKLKECHLVDGKSEDFRKLLKKAMKL